MRIDQLYAFIAVYKDGNEGVAAMQVDGGPGFLPMVGPDLGRLESLKPIAGKLATELGVEIRLVRFSQRELMETYQP